MNAMDYLSLAALVIAALYTFYRLFLGYMASRALENEGAGDSAISDPVRPVAEVGKLKR